MATNFKATMAKRQREMGQKDRVRDRLERRNERKARAEARAASGQVGPEIGEPQPSLTDDLPPMELPEPTPGASNDSQ
ncbi:MAG: hypothetical protein R2939_09540 [Kofleriaceae bacterium]